MCIFLHSLAWFLRKNFLHLIHKETLHLRQCSLHRQVFYNLLNYIFHFNAVNRLLDKEFDSTFIRRGNHIFRRNLRQHNKRKLRVSLGRLFYKCNPIHNRHKQIYDHNIRLYIFQVFHCIFCIKTCPTDFTQIAVLNNQF